MKHIKEICREIADEWNLMVPENVKLPGRQLKMSDIMSEEEWLTSGLTRLAARPGIGKTALAIDFVLDATRWMEKAVIFFSLKNDETQLVYRMIRNMTGQNYKNYRNCRM